MHPWKGLLAQMPCRHSSHPPIHIMLTHRVDHHHHHGMSSSSFVPYNHALALFSPPTRTQDIREGIARADTTELKNAMLTAYATTFTAEELAFLADVSFSEIGKRVQKKMPNYVSKVHPVMQDFAKRIFADINAKNEAVAGKGAGENKGQEKQRRAAQEVLKSAAGMHSEL